MLAILNDRALNARPCPNPIAISERLDVRATGKVERIIHPAAAHGVALGEALLVRARFHANDLFSAAAMFGGTPGSTQAATLASPRGVVAAVLGRLRWRGSDDLRDGTVADLDEDDARYPLIVLNGERFAGFELFMLNTLGAVLAVRPTGCSSVDCPSFQLGRIDETGRLSIGATGRLYANFVEQTKLLPAMH